jgi:hypothetical protein
MSRSWDKGRRNLIQEIKDTLRLQFKGAYCYAENVVPSTRQRDYALGFYPHAYGGVFFQEEVSIFTTEFEFSSVSHLQPLAFRAVTEAYPTRFSHVAVEDVDTTWQRYRTARLVPVLTKSLSSVSHRNVMIRSIRDYTIAKRRLEITKLSSIGNLQVGKFAIPRTSHRKAAIKTRTFPMSQSKKTMPIQRKPIPPHRFSSHARTAFRELLAVKSGLPAIELQIVSVYDRVYLGLYRSLSPAEDGTLYCIPKTTLDSVTATAKELLPVYLIIGKAMKQPGKTIQAVMPMHELVQAGGSK